ncbi:c-type cytochrome [Pseudooceanicola sp. MF1-13]|uniref:c-type cytochrome n=1 Tax=Pseudooceanicola sp. MF1-13 TaxID=3379095 RepID=UPI0038927051
MKTRHLAFALAIIGTGAIAHANVKDPQVKARMQLMEQIKDATGVLGNMAKQPSTYNQATAAAAKADLIAASTKVTAAFQTPATDPASEASPKIWENWADFTAKANGLTSAAQALDASSAQGVAAGMAGIGGACGACHKPYRL